MCSEEKAAKMSAEQGKEKEKEKTPLVVMTQPA
jgi:hypothetical protein